MTDRFNITLNHNDRAEIKAAANRQGVSIAGFLRMAALEKARGMTAPDRADDEADFALTVEEAVGVLRNTEVPAEWTSEGAIQRSALNYAATVLATLAPASGLAKLAELRAEARESAMQALASMGQAQEAYEAQLKAEAERETLAAEVARLRDRERVLSAFIAEFAAAKIDALRYQPAYGESPEDEPDPVVEAETVWAWQADAKAALSAGMAGEGGEA